MGTGQTLALLPPQNATGNFVKIVQRLPVRIELTDYDPDKRPLFIGLSVDAVRLFQGAADRATRRRMSAAASPLPEGAGQVRSHRRSVRLPRRQRAMSTRSTVASDARRRRDRAVNPWLVAAAVVMPTFMEVLDTTIANVALRYIAGGLSAAVTDSEWVITSYLAANAIILPISGWLSAHLGRRNYFLLSIAVFTLASALCGMATSLRADHSVPRHPGTGRRRIAALAARAMLLDAFPPEKQGAALTMFGIAALHRPGRRPDARRLSHRSTTTGAGSSTSTCPSAWSRLLAATSLVDDPGISEASSEPSCGASRSTSTTSAWACWRWSCRAGKSMLSKGQEWDWLGDPFWRVQNCWSLFVAAAWAC